MTSSELLDLFREEMNDVAQPYLWSDAIIFAYLDATQKTFCRLTEGIEDSTTTAVTQAVLDAGEEWITLDPRVLKVREVVDASTGRPYKIFNMETATEYGVLFNGRQGQIEAFVSGLSKHKLRAWPIPTAQTTVRLRVFRLPLEAITDAGDQSLEVDEQHHFHLLTGMKALAYLKEDVETFNKTKASEHDTRFRAYCEQSRREQGRVRREVGTVLYAGL